MVSLELIGAISLGLGILLLLSGSGIIDFQTYINISKGWATAVIGIIFAVGGVWLLYIGLVPAPSQNSGLTGMEEIVQVPTSTMAVKNTVTPTLTVEAVVLVATDTPIVVEDPVSEPTLPIEEPVTPTEVAPDEADAEMTLTEEVVGTETAVKLQTTATNVGIFAGPSRDDNPRLGLLNFNDELEVLGKVRGGIWYEVKAESGVIGWVDANEVEFISGGGDDVPITWPSASSSDGEQGPVTTTTCMSTAVARNATGTIFIKWSNLPDDARWLYLTIRGELNGEMTDLIQPNNKIDVNDRDTAAKGFELGSYLFNPDDPSSKGFPTGTNFNFTLQAQDAGGNSLCVVSGNFQ